MAPVFVPTPTMIHHGKLACAVCGRLITWVKKPENVGKKRRPPQDHLGWLFEDEHIDYCQLCMRARRSLPTGTVLDVHHIVEVQNGGTDDRANLLLLCNVCHRIVHLLRLYRSAPADLEEVVAAEVNHA
jgi:hypothetical protein